MSKYEFKGTPGHWHADGNVVFSKSEGFVCACTGSPHTEHYDAQAISEVPGLIEALRNLLHNYESLVYAEYEGTRFLDGQLDKTKEAHTVLTKATGESTGGNKYET